MTWDPRLAQAVAQQPYPLLFVTVSGAHLYGFPSPDSDWDLRGVHVLRAEDVVGLKTGPETIEVARDEDGLELDLVTHDALKFFRLLLRPNGYALEQLLSPLVLHTTKVHEELRSLAPRLITRRHRHHYVGFTHTQWGLLEKEDPPRVKPLLYVYRVLLTGIHLMRTGVLEANLLTLNGEYRLPWIPDLVARKTGGVEDAVLSATELARHAEERDRLLARLEAEHARSTLPEQPDAHEALNDLLVRIRLRGVS